MAFCAIGQSITQRLGNSESTLPLVLVFALRDPSHTLSGVNAKSSLDRSTIHRRGLGK